MQKIAICEDESIWRDQLTTILNKIQTNGELIVDTFSSGEQLLEHYRKGKYDLLFIDIYMPGKSGIETVTEIRKMDSDVSIVFTTTSLDHALEAYRLNVIKYLEKPIKHDDILECLQIAKMKRTTKKEITLMISGRERSFLEENIAYLEQKNHSIILNLVDGTTVSFTNKLDILQNSFSTPPFYRCHKSYLVNLDQVSILNKSLLVFEMKNNKNVYISRSNLKEAQKIFDEYIFDKLKNFNQ